VKVGESGVESKEGEDVEERRAGEGGDEGEPEVTADGGEELEDGRENAGEDGGGEEQEFDDFGFTHLAKDISETVLIVVDPFCIPVGEP